MHAWFRENRSEYSLPAPPPGNIAAAVRVFVDRSDQDVRVVARFGNTSGDKRSLEDCSSVLAFIFSRQIKPFKRFFSCVEADGCEHFVSPAGIASL